MSYTLDDVGNRLARNSTLPGVNSTASTFDANDRLATDSYDANGNTVGSSLGTDTYDFEDRLISRNNGQVVVVYDGDGNRVRKTVAGVTTLFLIDDQNPTGYAQVVEELTSSGGPAAVTRVYAYGNELISQDQFDGSTWVASFYGYDGHGNVRYLTDSTGTDTDAYDYDAFGNLMAIEGTTPNTYLYTGERFDTDLDLYFLRARYLNADSGRFWTSDSFEGFRTDPLSLHKYLYAAADPINTIDPSGHMSTAEIGVVSAEVGNRSKEDAVKARQSFRMAKRVLCTSSYGVGKATHHILPVFAGPKRRGGSEDNLSTIFSSQWHIDLHTLIGRALVLAGLPYPNIPGKDYAEILQDPKKRLLFIQAMRLAYRVWDKKCSPPAPSLLNDFNDLVRRERWENL
jgi:RHS repeat-associated protein